MVVLLFREKGVSVCLAETITLMEHIDEVIDEHGGWPIE
jgi:hypothetical protein